MNYLHDHPHASRVLLVAVAAMALLVAMSAAAAAEPAVVTSDQFAPGWQADAHPLFRTGVQRMTGRDRYYVPAILPRGDYVVIRRTGDKAELVDYRFSVTSDNAQQYLFLEPAFGGNLEALPVRDVPSLAQARQRGLR